MRAALDAVAPAALLARALRDPAIAGALHGDVLLCAAGKASAPFADALAAAGRVQVSDAVVTARGSRPHFSFFESGHPTPTGESVRAAEAALALAGRATHDRPLVTLLSGGASAMLALPARGLALADKVETSRLMLQAGLAIEEMNCVRKHLSAIKGGWLAARAARSVTLAISDVIGSAEDDPSVIGSGPTVSDPSTYAQALAILERHQLLAGVPDSVRTRLQRGARGEEPETPKPGDARLRQSSVHVIGNRRDAMAGSAKEAERRGFRVVIVDEPTLGEARVAGPAVVARALRLAADENRPCCVISSGETTVHVRGDGRGGRNQELALASLDALAEAGADVVLASVGTDGVDGPTDAAGAIVDSRSRSVAGSRGVDIDRALAANDAYPALETLGALVKTGPTGTNVGDLQVVVVGRGMSV